MMSVEKAYLRWCAAELEDAALTAELAEIQDKPERIYDRFYKDLTFGTAGLRGELGAGPNRMNIYTVRRATQALADYLKARHPMPSAAIAYDSRRNSRLFAEETARVFAANGIKTCIFEQLAPTPLLSFAVRELGCQAGVNITASHNPAEYNGYKAYDAQGCQITGEMAEEVMQRMLRIDLLSGAKLIPLREGLQKGSILFIGREFVQQYLNCVLDHQVNPGSCRDSGLKIVYTPLNGAGREPVIEILQRIGVRDIIVVPEQEWPDGNFPTCPYPNPENPQAMQLGLTLAEQYGADLLLATDPDSDRVSTAVLQDGKPRLITGNELGCLLLDYIASSFAAAGKMPQKPVAVRSFVSTALADRIAEHYGVQMRTVLTGFKYIGGQIALLEQEGEADRFLFAFEESCGYLSGSYVRDKDAVCASMLICEMAAWYKRRGMHLGQAMDALYERFGYCLDRVDSFSFSGSAGMQQMADIIKMLRAAPPQELAEVRISAVQDYLNAQQTGLPPADALAFELGKAGRITVRPSGTEPKLKVYYSLHAEHRVEAAALYETLQNAVKRMIGG